ncbi:hypothetical protein B0H67DRAFT_514248 [Lasiosphaeris hirsuta]|uniref:Uncharacterized protein n=1 Tax=Lasiosphaeris hirsuta TaxID=260670 RepID=A0AA40AGD5_9PEZI|nr:hypothetical protein B0H67DRAFT_514248 [Lasiosphaeris hirsuta]
MVSNVVATTTRVETYDIAIPSYITAEAASTLTDSDGTPTATVISTPPPVSTPTVVTLTDAHGAPKATVLTSVLVLPTVTILTGSDGVVTATVTVYPTYPTGVPVPQEVPGTVYYLSRGQYFVGFFLPPIAAGLLSIPIRMVDFSAKQYQPWHELTRPGGASARESLCLRTDGIHGVLSSVRSLAGGQALVFLTTLLTLCSALLVPLSAEAVALKLAGSCTETDFRGCAMTLGVFLIPARIVMGLMVFMVVLILLILVILRRWRSGVTSDPWSIAGMASLSMSPDIKALLRSLPTGLQGRIRHKQLIDALEEKTFKLGYFSNSDGAPEYGIMVAQGAKSVSRNTSGSTFFKASRYSESMVGVNRSQTEHHLPFLMLSYTGRMAFLLLLSGILAVVGYYYSPNPSAPFERFMDTQSFGVRALFTLLGVCITFFWSSFFNCLTIVSPYHLLSQDLQPAHRSILLSPPLHALAGMWSARQRRHPFLIVVAVTAILGEFMPLLLNNVPFRLTQTYITHMICTWLAIVLMCIMWLVVAASFFLSWPHMPVDPSTIAGAVYYVCDSKMLSSFEGLSVLGQEERDRRVEQMPAKFAFGSIVGKSGTIRTGVDAIHDDM